MYYRHTIKKAILSETLCHFPTRARERMHSCAVRLIALLVTLSCACSWRMSAPARSAPPEERIAIWDAVDEADIAALEKLTGVHNAAHFVYTRAAERGLFPVLEWAYGKWGTPSGFTFRLAVHPGFSPPPPLNALEWLADHGCALDALDVWMLSCERALPLHITQKMIANGDRAAYKDWYDYAKRAGDDELVQWLRDKGYFPAAGAADAIPQPVAAVRESMWLERDHQHFASMMRELSEQAEALAPREFSRESSSSGEELD